MVTREALEDWVLAVGILESDVDDAIIERSVFRSAFWKRYGLVETYSKVGFSLAFIGHKVVLARCSLPLMAVFSRHIRLNSGNVVLETYRKIHSTV
jgi:hypothetical protein